MSIFEALMLICFGSAWPFSIYRSFRSRSNKGKSVLFLWIVFFGYVFGLIHKIQHGFDIISYLYAANGLMVLADMILYYRNMALDGNNT